jgi:hypothetical protein
MNNECKHTHEHEFFIDNVTKTFYQNEWQTAIKKNLFDEQEAKFFNTQLFISHHNSLTNEIIKSIKERDPLSTQMDIFNIKKLTDDEKSDLDDIKYRKLVKERIRHLDNIIQRNKIELGRMKYNPNWTPNNINQIDDEKKELIPIVIMSCIKDNCRGLVNTKYICGLCKTNYCNDCRIIKNYNHICKKEDLDTVQYLKKETKPCPKCKVPISKKDGCNQMWCVGCHTPFDWITGQIITRGAIHNPEYYDYLRKISPNGQIPRNMNELPCNDNNIISVYELKQNQVMLNLHRNLIHFHTVIRQKYPYGMNEIKTRELRINYLLNKIDKDKFLQLLSQMNKKSQQNKDYLNIIDMIIRSTNDVMRTNIRNTNYKSLILTQTQIIADIANEAFSKIDKRWNSSSMRIDNMIKPISIYNKPESDSENETDELSDIDIDEIADLLAPDPNNIYQRGF